MSAGALYAGAHEMTVRTAWEYHSDPPVREMESAEAQRLAFGSSGRVFLPRVSLAVESVYSAVGGRQKALENAERPGRTVSQ
jgi:hypothetical protein